MGYILRESIVETSLWIMIDQWELRNEEKHGKGEETGSKIRKSR